LQRDFNRKTPAIKVKFNPYEIRVGTRLHCGDCEGTFRQQIISAINNRFTNHDEETCFTFFKASEINVEDMMVFAHPRDYLSYSTNAELHSNVMQLLDGGLIEYGIRENPLKKILTVK
jgi:hypothetical protein